MGTSEIQCGQRRLGCVLHFSRTLNLFHGGLLSDCPAGHNWFCLSGLPWGLCAVMQINAVYIWLKEFLALITKKDVETFRANVVRNP